MGMGLGGGCQRSEPGQWEIPLVENLGGIFNSILYLFMYFEVFEPLYTLFLIEVAFPWWTLIPLQE